MPFHTRSGGLRCPSNPARSFPSSPIASGRRPLVASFRQPARSFPLAALASAAALLAACSVPRTAATSQEPPLGEVRSEALPAGSSDPNGEVPAIGGPADAASRRTALVWVNGMGCPLCATNVDQQLRRVAGVEAVRINLGTGIVRVDLDPRNMPAESDLAKAVVNSGFTLVRIQMPGSGGTGGDA